MAKRYSPVTVVVWVGAFALLGYMGARLSQKQASLKTAGAPPAAVHAETRKTLAPSKRDHNRLAARTPTATSTSVSEAADASAQAGLAAAPALPSNASAGASTTVRAPQSAQPSPPTVALKDASAARGSGETTPGKREMLSTPADTTRSEEHARLAAHAAAARQSAFGADDMPVEKSRGKRTRTHQARHRDIAGNGGAPIGSHDRRYAARGDLPVPPAPGFRLLPFLPTFLPF
jgi:hypothetical protein